MMIEGHTKLFIFEDDCLILPIDFFGDITVYFHCDVIIEYLFISTDDLVTQFSMRI